MATRSLAMTAAMRRPEPLFRVLGEHPSLAGRICELASSQVIMPGSLLSFIEPAILEPAIIEPAVLLHGAVSR